MAQQEIEIILSRHWASLLETPIFLVDPAGNLLFFNEPAEVLLGRRFAETDQMSAEVWGSVFSITDDDGVLVPAEELPLSIALAELRPAHRRFWVTGLDNITRHIETSCFPLIGQAGRFVGAVAIFWELTE